MKRNVLFSVVGFLAAVILIAVCISIAKPDLVGLGPDPAANSQGNVLNGLAAERPRPLTLEEMATILKKQGGTEEYGSLFDYLEPRQIFLVGLEGVQVYVDSLRNDRQSYGLTREQLQIDVELQLRQAGIRVFSAQELLKMPRQPVLFVTVAYQPVVYADLREVGVYACSITMQLFEDMRLERDARISSLASGWTRQGVNAIPVSLFAKMVREALHDLTASFVNDYLAANPKN
jgi:hypothetical protein